jgi:class 3 adenylate cyclase/tetratricopeptide (TPR) repeat protein
MLCSKCGVENPPGKKFCGDCGAPLANLCPKCGADSPPGKRFCGECGAALGAPAAAAVERSETASIRVAGIAASENLDGERKLVTALFADLQGSTALMEALDPEEAHAIVAPALQIMAEAVRRYDGYVARSTGDGIFALFGAPAAYEDHPQRALYAALEMQRELRADGQRLAAQGLRSLEARVGVHTGEVVAYSVETGGKLEYRLVGHTANLAARLESIAPVGSIAVSEYTRRLCEGYFELRALGPMTVKGLSEPIEVYEVLGLGPLRTHFQLSTRRGLTRFVGRERELEQMRRALEQARSGQGQLVAVMAEAGTGKSRLFHEFRAAIPPTCKVLEAYSVSHGKASAWLPVLELLRGYFGIQDADDAVSRREKVRNAMTVLDSALDGTLPYLFGLLGIAEGPDPLAQMDPQIKRQRTLDAIKRIILSESLKQPVVVIFEDLHWIDTQTQALLDQLADGLARVSVLLLVNYRPEYRHEWTNKSYYSQLPLGPLGGEDGAAMLASLLGENVELDPLKRLIAERTGGNPFFIEEIVQALFDEGALMRNGAVKVTRSLSQLRLPPTVQGILAARIDRLSAAQKDLLQTLAVIGRESPLELISQIVAPANTQLEQMLTQLQAGEFIYEQPASTGVEYVFKHALTQEVAYSSLLIERRKLLHERTGQALELMFANQLDDHLTQLALHYSHSDNLDKAIEFLGRAGQQAIERSAHADAITNLSAAINLLQKLPDSPARDQRELRLQLVCAQALIPLKGFDAAEVERACIRARELCKRLGDPPELFAATVGLWYVYYLRGDWQTAYELAEQLLRLGQSSDDSTRLMLAQGPMGDTLASMKEFRRAREHLEMGVSLYDHERHQRFRGTGVDPGVNDLSYLAVVLWSLGYPDRALDRGNKALALANASSHPHSLAFARSFVGRVHQYRGETLIGQKIAEDQIAQSAKHGFSHWLAQGTCERGAALAAQGHNEEGIVQMREGLAALRANAARPQFLWRLAQACMKTDRFDEGLSALREALAITGEDSDVHRVKGELLLAQDHSRIAEAQKCLEWAIELARKHSARSVELRATMSLAQLLAKQGRREEAHTILAEIYSWFTEGFDTADLKDAKALLDELGT